MKRTAALGILSVAMVSWVYVTGRDFPVTGLFDLGIHELGHLLAIPFGQMIHFLAGSGLQIAAPAGLAGYFWFKGDHAASAFLVAWTSTSIKDVAIYMADAPFRRLQLIGGTHDWWWLFGQWGNRDIAPQVGGFVGFLGLMVGLAAIGWFAHQVYADVTDEPTFVFVD